MTRVQWVSAAVIATGVALAIWRTLVTGGGLVGGDTYPYFFPQKQVMAEALRNNQIPLWHDRTGLGYPLLAESQAGVFYPLNPFLYRFLDINSAYSTTVVLHYILAFLLTWRFVRTQNVSHGSALLAAVIFVYGWFPARVSLEWSIIGGVWFPASLWMTDRLLRKPSLRRFACLSFVFAAHLLAGHFTLAFITQLCCCGYAVIRGWQNSREESATGIQTTRSIRKSGVAVLPVAGAILVSLALASVQLIPTLELKRLSQREGVSTVFDPGYGHLPPVYITQLFASWWFWHTPEAVATRELSMYPLMSISSATNQVEAHMYFGLLPLALLILSTGARLRIRLDQQVWRCWALLGILSLIYATGWLIPISRHLPGFGFFMGPGRYTIITTLAAGIIAGQTLDALLIRRKPVTRYLVSLMIGVLTLFDVTASSQYPVRDAVAVEDAPVHGLKDSWVRAELMKLGEGNVRLLAPGPNVTNLYGVSSVPQYLGLGPAEYYVDEKTYRTGPDKADATQFPSPAEVEKLMERGVTHLLTTDRIPVLASEIELMGEGPDSFLNNVWNRGMSPCFLYRFKDPPSRVFVRDSEIRPDWSWVGRSPSDITFQITLTEDSVVGLRELMLPGWQVTVDGQPNSPEAEGGFARFVRVTAGSHQIQWTYRPTSFLAGSMVSLGSFIGLVFCCIMRTSGKPDGRDGAV